MIDPKERFSDRVEDYVRYRPAYPREVLDFIVRLTGLGPGRVAADVGAGTGIFTSLLLQSGARVIAVEPNASMRAAAQAALSTEPRFESVSGSAEATGLAGAALDLVAAAQAFHWFDPLPARAEFARILRPGGFAALVWNLRKESPFLRDYEEMLERFATDYARVRMREKAAESNVRAFFAPEIPVAARLEHEQLFDETGLRGRLMSSSYAPRAGEKNEAMLARLTEIFRAHQRGGVVTFGYETCVYGGRLSSR